MSLKKAGNKKNEAVEEKPFVKVKITSGDSLIRLPNRMIVVEDDFVIVTREEYAQLRAMKVC